MIIERTIGFVLGPCAYLPWSVVLAYRAVGPKQNRESTEGYSKSIIRKNNDKFGKRIGL